MLYTKIISSFSAEDHEKAINKWIKDTWNDVIILEQTHMTPIVEQSVEYITFITYEEG